MAPDEFSPKEGYQYVAVYPAMQKDTEGKVIYDYYAGDINSSTIALRDGNNMVTDFYNLRIYQDDLNSANHLKRYDAMFSTVEFNDDNAEINFIKLNTVIKWEISGLNAGSTVNEFVFETNGNFTLNTNGQLSFMDILYEGCTEYSSKGSSDRFTMKLGNQEEGWTIPADGKLNIYMPMVGCSSWSNGRELLGDYTFTLKGPEAVYGATATLNYYKYLDPGKVHVFKVKLSALE